VVIAAIGRAATGFMEEGRSMGRAYRKVAILTSVMASVVASQVSAQLAQPPSRSGAASPPPTNGAAARAPQPAQGVQPRTNPPAIKPNDPRMKQILREWEKRSTLLKTLDVKITRIDDDPAWNVHDEYRGRAFLKSPNLACLDFHKVVEEKGKKALVHSERIICTGNDVWQYKSDTHQIFIFPLDKETQKRALEEGPLPFLFQMRAAEAEARYVMNVISEGNEYFVIGVYPKLKIDQESFSQAFLQLNKSNYLPGRIKLISPNGKGTKDFKLSEVQPNVKVEEANFKGVLLGAPWKVVRNPGEGPEGGASGPRVGAQRAPLLPKGASPRRE
jgi:TIGR03009 family protein